MYIILTKFNNESHIAKMSGQLSDLPVHDLAVSHMSSFSPTKMLSCYGFHFICFPPATAFLEISFLKDTLDQHISTHIQELWVVDFGILQTSGAENIKVYHVFNHLPFFVIYNMHTNL